MGDDDELGQASTGSSALSTANKRTSLRNYYLGSSNVPGAAFTTQGSTHTPRLSIGDAATTTAIHFACMSMRILHFGSDFWNSFTPASVTFVSTNQRLVRFLIAVSSFRPASVTPSPAKSSSV